MHARCCRLITLSVSVTLAGSSVPDYTAEPSHQVVHSFAAHPVLSQPQAARVSLSETRCPLQRRPAQ